MYVCITMHRHNLYIQFIVEYLGHVCIYHWQRSHLQHHDHHEDNGPGDQRVFFAQLLQVTKDCLSSQAEKEYVGEEGNGNQNRTFNVV